MKHGMKSEDARRIRLTGNQLKKKFLDKYTEKGILLPSVELVQPLSSTIPRSVLIKSGQNWQFRLGRIAEIENVVTAKKNNSIRFKLFSIQHHT
jgi:hypothetical protein